MSRFVQYLYFLRFSLLPWLALPILASLDYLGVTTSMTRGIFALESYAQVFWTTFFVLSANTVVLITARVVCVNGVDRFSAEPPPLFVKLLGKDCRERTLSTLMLVQTAGLMSLIYVGYVTVEEGSMGPTLFFWYSLLGVGAAFGFWFLVLDIAFLLLELLSSGRCQSHEWQGAAAGFPSELVRESRR